MLEFMPGPFNGAGLFESTLSNKHIGTFPPKKPFSDTAQTFALEGRSGNPAR